ncbi:MAG: HAD family phosphatase [Chloroflexi bacterium]|nr:HAD family phosphatase [Chloroflexota bacterium]
MTKKAAFLDVDGVISKGYWLGSLIDELVRLGLFDRTQYFKIKSCLAEYKSGELDYRTAAREITSLYAPGLKGQKFSEISKIAGAVFEKIKDEKYFPDTYDMIRLFKDLDFRVVLITGSPIEIIRLVGEDLGADVFALTCEVEDDIYTGRILLDTAYENIKKRCILNYAAINGIDLKSSAALGDSIGDVEMLRAVGIPVPSDPGGELADEAAANGWNIVSADNDRVGKLKEILTGGSIRQ